jgi:hypothetical protein
MAGAWESHVACAPVDVEAVRRMILALPEVEEYDHGGLPAFRVRGKRFASMLDESGINLMPGEPAIRMATETWPDACTERWFGRRLAAVRVALPTADDIIEELVIEAWASKAPKRVAREFLGAA